MMFLKKVLLVSDRLKDLSEVQGIFELFGSKYSLHCVSNGKEALSVLMGSSHGISYSYPRLKKVRPDIILINSELPDMDAIALSGIIRKYYSLKDIKLFLLLDQIDLQVQDRFKELAFTGFIPRPFRENLKSTGLMSLKSELNSSSRLAWFPAALIKTGSDNTWRYLRQSVTSARTGFVHMSIATGVKIVVYTASIVSVSGADYRYPKPVLTTFQKQEAIPLTTKTELPEATDTEQPEEEVLSPILPKPEEAKISEDASVAEDSVTVPAPVVKHIDPRIKVVEESDSLSQH